MLWSINPELHNYLAILKGITKCHSVQNQIYVSLFNFVGSKGYIPLMVDLVTFSLTPVGRHLCHIIHDIPKNIVILRKFDSSDHSALAN